MYFVPDDTEFCGFYECSSCDQRFLNLRIVPRMVCPYCGETVDMEIGPDEEMPQQSEDAVLLQVVEGKEAVEQMDGMLSLAITGGNYDWL